MKKNDWTNDTQITLDSKHSTVKLCEFKKKNRFGLEIITMILKFIKHIKSAFTSQIAFPIDLKVEEEGKANAIKLHYHDRKLRIQGCSLRLSQRWRHVQTIDSEPPEGRTFMSMRRSVSAGGGVWPWPVCTASPDGRPWMDRCISLVSSLLSGKAKIHSSMKTCCASWGSLTAAFLGKKRWQGCRNCRQVTKIRPIILAECDR